MRQSAFGSLGSVYIRFFSDYTNTVHIKKKSDTNIFWSRLTEFVLTSFVNQSLVIKENNFFKKIFLLGALAHTKQTIACYNFAIGVFASHTLVNGRKLCKNCFSADLFIGWNCSLKWCIVIMLLSFTIAFQCLGF